MKRILWFLVSFSFCMDHYVLEGSFKDANIYQYGNLLLVKNIDAVLIEQPHKSSLSYLNDLSNTDVMFTVNSGSYCLVKNKENTLTIDCYDQKDDEGRVHLMLDAGHGGKDSGAVSAKGLKEKHVTLSYVNKLVKFLDHPLFKISLTRDKDVYVDKYDRLRHILATKPDIVLSIHADAYVKPSITGIGLYHLDESKGSLLSQKLISEYPKVENVRGYSEELANKMLGMLREDYKLHIDKAQGLPLVILRSPMCVSMLLELGFLSNPEEANYLASENYLEGFAEDVANHLIQIVMEKEQIIYIAVFD